MEELPIEVLSIRKISDSISNASEISTPIDGGFGSEEAIVTQKERREGDSDGRKLLPPRQALFATIAMVFNSVIIGMVLGYTSTALPDMRQAIANGSYRPFRAFTVDEESWFASCVALSALVGGLCGGSLADRFGRQCVAISLLVPVAIGWLIVVSANEHWHLYIGRLFTGWGIGIAQGVVPVYVAEIAPTAHRGMLLSFHALSLNVGALISYIAGAYMSWRWLAVFNIGVCTLAACGLALVPESPRWLLLKGRRLEAVRSLCWLRGSRDVTVNQELTAELKGIEDSVAVMTSDIPARFADLKQRRLYHPLLLTLGLMCFQVGSGIDVIWFYTVTIFQTALGSTETTTTDGMNAFSESIIVGAVAVAGNLMAATVMDRAGRKPMLIISGAVMIASTATMGAYFYLLEVDKATTVHQLYWLPLLCLVVYLLGFDLAWGPLPSAMMGELLPNRSRGVASSFTVAWLWLCIFLITKFYVNVSAVLHPSGAFWMFTAFAAGGVLFVVLALPETKNKSLEEIEKVFH